MASGIVPPVRTVVSDVGGVLIKFDEAAATAIEARWELDPGSLLPTLLKSDPSRAAMRGDICHDDWFSQVSRVITPQAVKEWLDYHGEADREVAALLRQVRAAGTRVVLLSNAMTRLWDDLAFHDLKDLADRTLCSADLGQVKPDVECFLLAGAEAGFDPATALFIDDTPSWALASQAAGMLPRAFTGVDPLRQELVRLGVLK